MVWKDGRKIPQLLEQDGIPYLQFKSLAQTGIVRHLFTTRGGGVSKGVYASMNLGFTRGDDPKCVEENFRRVAELLGCRQEDMVSSDQTHTTNVRLVTGDDRGHGITRKKTFFDTDGLVTDEPGIVLATFYADCVPLYFVDPVRHAIGLSHSGWRGTVQGIGEATVEKMRECFGSKPEDIIAAVGPSICADCYEVGQEVAEYFLGEFWEKYHNDKFRRLAEQTGERNNTVQNSETQNSAIQNSVKQNSAMQNSVIQNNLLQNTTTQKSLVQNSAMQRGTLLYQKTNNASDAHVKNRKYQLNLWVANQCVLEKAGILPEHIEMTTLCTCCNSEELFSHRASQGKRGNMGAFLGLL